MDTLSIRPAYQSLPGFEPSTTGAVLAIVPAAPVFDHRRPSTTSRTWPASFQQVIVCQRPSVTTGPACRRMSCWEPLKRQVTRPSDQISALYIPPRVDATPL